MEKSKKNLILIAGGSGSGKTTLVNEIKEIINNNNQTISFINLDDYYLNQDGIKMEERKKVNYDHPSAFQWDQLNNDIKSLLKGSDVIKSKYVHKEYTHSPTEVTKIVSSDVIILEGIFALYDKRIVEKGNIRIFVDTDSDIRIIRRIKRDILTNGRKLEDLLETWQTQVKPMYRSFIHDTKMNADIIIPNTSDRVNDVAIDIIRTKIVSLLKK